MIRQVDRELLLGFIEEARSYLPAIKDGLRTYQADATRQDGLEVAHRHVHTIKGASSMVGLAGLSHIAYHVEELLEEIGAETVPFNPAADRFLQNALDAIEMYLDGVVAERLHERPLVSQVVHDYRRLLGLPEETDDVALADVLDELDKTAAHAPDPELPPTMPEPTVGRVAAPSTPAPAPTENNLEISAELMEIFAQEAQDHLHNVSSWLNALSADPQQTDLIQEIRRAVHTLKGGAATVGLGAVAQLAHRMEDLLDLLYEDDGPELTADTLDLLFRSADALEDMMTGRMTEADDARRLADIYGAYARRLDTFDAADIPSAAELGAEPVIDLTQMSTLTPPTDDDDPAAATGPAVNVMQPGEIMRVPLARLDEIIRAVSELVITRTTFEQKLGGMVHLAAEFEHSMDRLRQVTHKLETQYEVMALNGRGFPAGEGFALGQRPSEFDELQMDRYTEFHLLSRELTETGSDLRTIGHELRQLIGDFDGVLGQQSRLSGELQDKLMRTRMVPLATLATRLSRTVRVVAQKQDKQVDLRIEGEQIEIDKKVLEEIADPLLHVLRNAVDHGIEPPALRQVLGKPARGTVKIKAYHQGNQVVLEISDDGAGLDPQMLRARAAKLGVVSTAEAAELSERELHELIFTAGFTTADEVSEISGRGVGLDVLRSSVHRLKGAVQVHSTPGKGTNFVVRLPMTMAVTRGLMVRCQAETYAVPLAAVSQIMRLDADQIDALGDDEVVRLDNRVYPVIRLDEALQLPSGGDASPPTRLPALVLDAGDKQVVLLVDEIMEGREIVVKTLGSHLRHVHGITGATLMGDGRIVLILNPAELIQEPAAAAQWQMPLRPAVAAQKPVTVMVVDDSVSVRRVVSGVVKNAGWQPVTAKDGLDALTHIQNAADLPDAILLDIEMPRMDGYELAATLMANDQYRRIPIVMLTSRAGEKHRRKAMELGVSAYLVKPYQDEELIGTVRRLVENDVSAPADAPALEA